jgi:hypothetical protein
MDYGFKEARLLLAIFILFNVLRPLSAIAESEGTSSSGGGKAFNMARDENFLRSRVQGGLVSVNEGLTAMINHKSGSKKILDVISSKNENRDIAKLLVEIQSQVIYPPKEMNFAGYITYTSELEYKFVKQCETEDEDACFFVENSKNTIGLVPANVKNMAEETFLGLLAHEVAHSYGADEKLAQDFQLYFMIFRSFMNFEVHWEIEDKFKIVYPDFDSGIGRAELADQICAGLPAYQEAVARAQRTVTGIIEEHASFQQKDTNEPAGAFLKRVDQWLEKIKSYTDYCSNRSTYASNEFASFFSQIKESEKQQVSSEIKKMQKDLLESGNVLRNIYSDIF